MRGRCSLAWTLSRFCDRDPGHYTLQRILHKYAAQRIGLETPLGVKPGYDLVLERSIAGYNLARRVEKQAKTCRYNRGVLTLTLRVNGARRSILVCHFYNKDPTPS